MSQEAALRAPKKRFKDHSFESRCKEAQRVRVKYPQRIPVIAEKAPNTDTPEISKKKYLVPGEYLVNGFQTLLRSRIQMNPNQSIYLFVNNVLPLPQTTMQQLYDEHKDPDGFLYITYSTESTFGGDE